VTTAAKAVNSSALLRIEVQLNKKPVQFVLDSGAEANVIDESSYEAIGRPAIKDCNERARLYDGSNGEFLGKGFCSFEFDGISTEQEFFVAKRGSMNLLSVQTMDKFGLLNMIKERIQRTGNSPVSDRKASESHKGAEQAQNLKVVASLQSCPQVRDDQGLCTEKNALKTSKSKGSRTFCRTPNCGLDRQEKMQGSHKFEQDKEAAPNQAKSATPKKSFNRRFVIKAKGFAVGDEVSVRGRKSQTWRSGRVLKCTGVIFDVQFSEGVTSRHHVSRVHIRPAADQDHFRENLAIFFETFGLPPPTAMMEPAEDEQKDFQKAEVPEPVCVTVPEPVHSHPKQLDQAMDMNSSDSS
jgi:hypothetical protein